MEGFLWGLLAAYIAAVLYVAYDKPDFYLSRLDSWVMFLPVVLFFFAGLWGAATRVGYQSVRDLIPVERLREAVGQFDKTQLPTEGYIILGGLFVLAWVASFLATGLRNHQKSKA